MSVCQAGQLIARMSSRVARHLPWDRSHRRELVCREACQDPAWGSTRGSLPPAFARWLAKPGGEEVGCSGREDLLVHLTCSCGCGDLFPRRGGLLARRPSSRSRLEPVRPSSVRSCVGFSWLSCTVMGCQKLTPTNGMLGRVPPSRGAHCLRMRTEEVDDDR